MATLEQPMSVKQRLHLYVKRLLYSPRWKLARKILGPLVLSGMESDQWFRIVLNRETERLISDMGPAKLRVLEISGTFWNRAGLFKEYVSMDYPAYDICAWPLDRSFDLIIAEQVFEHLLWPYRAGRNTWQMLAPGGALLITTPFLIRIHNHPHDCSRWTETGLKYFLAECGFPLEKIITGSWGNRACVKANFSRWQVFQPWRHSLRNEPDFPVVVWALARKESS
jgi:SAM-dependent methyltransferase